LQEQLADATPIQAALLSDDPAAVLRYPDRSGDPSWAGRAEADSPIPDAAPDALDPRPSFVRERPAAAVDDHTFPSAPTRAERLPELRALAQLAQTYLLTEGPAGALYLIDQHAAHERITYERLLAQHGAGACQSQALLIPQDITLPPDAQQALLGAVDELAAWGFALAEADRGVQVHAVPAGLTVENLAATLSDLAGHLGGADVQTPADRRAATLATLACHTSVRAGQTLSLLEQQALLDQLAGCEGPRTCPHGRPTLIVLTQHQLERQFGRLGV
jgi:DNA mismatch repair protein MutL